MVSAFGYYNKELFLQLWQESTNKELAERRPIGGSVILELTKEGSGISGGNTQRTYILDMNVSDPVLMEAPKVSSHKTLSLI